MTTSTIDALTSIGAVATNDELAVWDTDVAATKSATVAQVLAAGPAALTGATNTFTQLQTFSAGIAFANETMSVYDTGTWTPTLAGSTTAGAQTYSVQLGYFIKIGTFVIAWCQINLSAKDGATAGNITINGLPFTARNITNMRYGAIMGLWSATATSFVSMLARISANTTQISLFGATAATATPASVVAADIGASTAFSVTAMYESA